MPQFTTSVTAAVAVPQNRLRKSIVFTNQDTQDNIFLDNRNIGTITTANAGIRLRPGDSIAFDTRVDGEAQVTDQWQAIASANTPSLVWFETENFQR
jgi:hypothetical protein